MATQGIPEGLGNANPPPPASAPSSGAPASAAAPAAAPAAPAPNAGSRNLFEAAQAAQANSPAGGGGGGGRLGAEELAQLLAQPAFQQLRTIVRQNPAQLPLFLQTLAQSNPGLMQIINNNQEAFMAALEEGDEGGEGGDGSQYVSVTAEENQALERMMAMVRSLLWYVTLLTRCAQGFERQKVLEAFLVCDRVRFLLALPSILADGLCCPRKPRLAISWSMDLTVRSLDCFEALRLN